MSKYTHKANKYCKALKTSSFNVMKIYNTIEFTERQKDMKVLYEARRLQNELNTILDGKHLQLF